MRKGDRIINNDVVDRHERQRSSVNVVRLLRANVAHMVATWCSEGIFVTVMRHFGSAASWPAFESASASVLALRDTLSKKIRSWLGQNSGRAHFRRCGCCCVACRASE